MSKEAIKTTTFILIEPIVKPAYDSVDVDDISEVFVTKIGKGGQYTTVVYQAKDNQAVIPHATKMSQLKDETIKNFFQRVPKRPYR